MQTERVTFLTTPDHKAALDAYAISSGKSVGHVVREATSRYIAQGGAVDDTDLAALVEQVNMVLPKMEDSFDQMSRTLQETHAEVDRLLREMGARR